VPEPLRRHPVELNWYPKLQALASQHGQPRLQPAELHEAKFTRAHLALLDFDAIYFELQRYKNERAWYNLAIPLDALRPLLQDGDWYHLLIPAEEMAFRSFEQVRAWQEIAVALLTRYCDRYYKSCKAAFEEDHLGYVDLEPDDGNFVSEYHILVEQSQEDIIAKLEEIKGLIQGRKLRDIEYGNFRAIMFGRHLYQPLLYVDDQLIEVRPMHLNEGERDFVLDLRDHYEQHRPFFQGRELYLLRNMSRGRGIGFFEAGNFYPDFIVWLVTPGGQRIAFVDPKGIRNLEGLDDPKIRFHEAVKGLEARLGDPSIRLSSFILAVTPYQQVSWWAPGLGKEQFEAHNVLFQVDDRGTYIGKLLEKMVADQPAPSGHA
jgi:hypothetical protein